MLLASAGALGGVMLYDGEVGTDEARLEYVAPGDAVTLKGGLDRFEPGPEPEWDHVRAHLVNATYLLTDHDEHMVLITGMPEGLDGDVAKVEGRIVFAGPHPMAFGELVVVHADEVTVPLLFR